MEEDMDDSIDTSQKVEVDETFSIMLDELRRSENFLAQGDADGALTILSVLQEEADALIADMFVANDKIQYFSFPSVFDRLAYRRVENDPRELINSEFPFDQLYSDIAFAQINIHDYKAAREALAQAVRWNPMNCAYRLDLAELYRMEGDVQEWAALSFSVFERAVDCRHLAQAYNNIGMVLASQGDASAAIGCLKVAEKMIDTIDGAQTILNPLKSMLESKNINYKNVNEEACTLAMQEEGIPEGANAEMAICLIMCATDYADMGNLNEATRLTILARDLVGQDACKALIALVRGEDSDGLGNHEQGESLKKDSFEKDGE